MSFGFSIGDFVGVISLAFEVYHSCANSPSEFRHLKDEVKSLHIVLEKAAQRFSGRRISADDTRSLQHVRESCEAVLLDLQLLIKKYKTLGGNGASLLKRLLWSRTDLSKIRERITSNVLLLHTLSSDISRYARHPDLELVMQFLRNMCSETSLPMPIPMANEPCNGSSPVSSQEDHAPQPRTNSYKSISMTGGDVQVNGNMNGLSNSGSRNTYDRIEAKSIFLQVNGDLDLETLWRVGRREDRQN
jgi:hypothetical protein